MENSEVKKATERKQIGVYENVADYISKKSLTLMPANAKLGIGAHHNRKVYIKNATEGEKTIILNLHYYGLTERDLGQYVNFTLTVFEKTVADGRKYLSVDFHKSAGRSQSVFIVNTERPELIPNVKIPYTNFGICIVRKVMKKLAIGIHPDVSAYVYGRLKQVAADADCNIEEHLRRDLYLANAIEGAKDVVVTLEYYGVNAADSDRQVNFNATIVENTNWNNRIFFTVKLRKAEGESRDCLLINTRRPELLGEPIPYTNASICILRKLSEEEQEDALRVSQQLAREQAREQARAARLPVQAQTQAVAA